MKRFPIALLLLGGLSASAPLHAADDPLDVAKTLYLSAAYEEALSALSKLPSTVDPDQTDKFRALCFLALNRTEDAQQALEKLATRHPLLKLDDGESPKLIVMFREARTRVLPAAAKSMYATAKTNFEQGQFTKAASQFADLQALLSEKDLAAQPAFSDLKMLAEGFAKLTEQQLASERAAAAAPKPAPAAPVVDPAPVEPSKIFTAADTEVLPPVPIEQTIPQWVPPAGNLRYQEFSGVLDVVIDETGAVVSATMAQRVNVIYDQVLLSATKRWRYRPAQRAGKPVKYRKLINVVLRPAAPGTEPPLELK
jgi:tetratricopeptide (TPR) repeat protein